MYASDDDRFIISETPAGVIDRHELATGQVTRIWPDGAEETFPADSPKYHEYPAWPRPTAARRAKGLRPWTARNRTRQPGTARVGPLAARANRQHALGGHQA